MNPTRFDAPNDQLVWLNGMIEVDRKNLAQARNALSQLRRICDANSITAMNFKPVYKYWLHLRARILAEEGRTLDAANEINNLRWIKGKLGYWSTPFDCAFFLDSAAQIYEKMGQISNAEQAYREALAYTLIMPWLVSISRACSGPQAHGIRQNVRWQVSSPTGRRQTPIQQRSKPPTKCLGADPFIAAA